MQNKLVMTYGLVILIACTAHMRGASAVPFVEGFENHGAMPAGWTQEQVEGTLAWSFRNGSPTSVPDEAYTGGYNACFAWQGTDLVTKLVTPELDLGAAPVAPHLIFRHCMRSWYGDRDELRIYYKTSAEGAWIFLTVFTSSVRDWTLQLIELPVTSRTFYLAFEGSVGYGYGVCLDDVEVRADRGSPIIMTEEILPSGFPGVPYNFGLTAMAGTAPYSWSIISNSLPQGLTMGSDGVVGGTPDFATTPATFWVRAEGANGIAATNRFCLSILPAVSLPFVETFEHGGAFPPGWTQAYGENVIDWKMQDGSSGFYEYAPESAHNGAFNACFAFHEDVAEDPKTRLVTPVIDLGEERDALQLRFWHCMREWDPGQDELRVFYKPATSGDWTLLAAYTEDVFTWTERVIELPATDQCILIAFEGLADFGYGVCIDDVCVVSQPSSPLIATTSLLPSGTVGVPYAHRLAAFAGETPYTWTVACGTWPLGLSLDASGLLGGTPEAVADADIDVQVSGANGYACTNRYALTIQQPRLLPFLETFEHAGLMPDGWTQESVDGDDKWRFRTGSLSKTPNSAYDGTYNACFFYGGESATHRLILPGLDLGIRAQTVYLRFWHCMAEWVDDGDIAQDKLRVYYKTSVGSEWSLLAEYAEDTPVWTERTLKLPVTSGLLFIAFEGEAVFGNGICLDDISLFAEDPYADWLLEHFTLAEIIADGLTGYGDDPDVDGIVNLMEFALHLDPRNHDASGRPGGGLCDGYLTVTYRQNKQATNLVYEVTACTNLREGAWSTAGVSRIACVDSNAWWEVTQRHDAPVTAAPTRFLRLKVSVP